MKKQIIVLTAGMLLAPSLLKILPFGEDSGWASCFSQNIGINTDGSTPETGVMLDVKEPTAKATTAAVQTFFQIKSFDANTDALKLRLGFKTDATQANRYGFIDFPDFTASVSTYLPLCLQPSGGNVGIGTTSPLGKLHVYGDLYVGNGTATYPSAPAGAYSNIILKGNTLDARLVMNDGTGNFQQYLNSYYETGVGFKYTTTNLATRFSASAGTFGFYVAPSGTAGNIITWTDGLFIANNGYVGIGTTTPGAKLEIAGQVKITGGSPALNSVLISDAVGLASWSSIAGAGGVTGTCGSGANYVPKMSSTTAITCSQIFDNGTNVGIGTTAPTYKLHVNGMIKTNGYSESSDIRLKKDIVPIGNALAKVEQLRGVYFNWRSSEFNDRNLDTTHQMGVIAQEIEKIFPEVVSTDKEGYKSVEYAKIVAVLIEAVKELKTENNNQKSSIKTLSEKYDFLFNALLEKGFISKEAAGEVSVITK